MAIEVGYPFYPTSLEPRPMKAQQIWTVAEQVRRQLAPSRQVPCLDLERLTRLAASMLARADGQGVFRIHLGDVGDPRAGANLHRIPGQGRSEEHQGDDRPLGAAQRKRHRRLCASGGRKCRGGRRPDHLYARL